MDFNNKEKNQKTGRKTPHPCKNLLFSSFLLQTNDENHSSYLEKMNDPSPDLIKDAEIHQKLNENQLSYEELFQRVDKNHDGKIDVDELIELLENLGVETTTQKRAAVARVSFSEINQRENVRFSFYL